VPSPLILLVEDDRESREGYSEYLERGGFRVAQAETAEDALEAIRRLQPDAVVTDIALPGRDGFALASVLRDELANRRVPVVAMTAYWASDIHDRAERSGIWSTLLKPCQPEHLIAELQCALQRSRGAERARSQPHP
jgi:CheY-like chemotaxis protein